MAWLMRRPSAPRAELAAARAPERASSPARAGAAAWGALVPEGPTATGLLLEQYPLTARTVHVGRTVNPLCALSLPLPQGAPPSPRGTLTAVLRIAPPAPPRAPAPRLRSRGVPSPRGSSVVQPLVDCERGAGDVPAYG